MVTTSTLKATDIEFRMSGGANNGNPFKSLGGVMSGVASGNMALFSGVMGSLWDFIPTSEAVSGLSAEYRCLYVRNANTTGGTLFGAKLWYESANVDSVDIENSIGVDPAGLNGTAQVIATEITDPINVTFSEPLLRTAGSFVLGDLKPGYFYPFWLKRKINSNANPYYQDAFVLRVEGEPTGLEIPPPPPGGGGTGGGGGGGTIASDFGFAVGGKWSCSSANAQINMAHLILRTTSIPSLKVALLGGDTAWTADPTCWFTMTSRINNITHIILGSLEQSTDLGAQPAIKNKYMTHYGLQSPYYSFNYQDVHFLILDTEIPYDTSSLQYKFALADLTAASTNAAIDWIIVSAHQHMYSAGGTYGDVNGFDHVTWGATYGPLFDLYHVDIATSAHPRNFQRTYPIKYNSSAPTSPIIAPGTTGLDDYTDPAGVIYLNVGTGGKSHDTGALATLPYFKYTNNTDFGYLYVTVRDTGSLLKGVFYNLSNNNIDDFSISKS